MVVIFTYLYTYHDIQGLMCGTLSHDVLKAIREEVSRPPILEDCPSNMEVLWIVNHTVPIEEEVTSFIRES